jgi:hypothetical protein
LVSTPKAGYCARFATPLGLAPLQRWRSLCWGAAGE